MTAARRGKRASVRFVPRSWGSAMQYHKGFIPRRDRIFLGQKEHLKWVMWVEVVDGVIWDVAVFHLRTLRPIFQKLGKELE